MENNNTTMMDKYIFQNNLSVIICIIVLILITLFFLLRALNSISTKKYKDVIFPTYKLSKKEKKDLFGEDKVKADKKKGSFGLKKGFSNFFARRGIDEKVKRFYVQAGHYDKTLEDLISDAVKYTCLGMGICLLLYLFLGNIWIGLLLGVFMIVFPFLNLFGDIQDRRNAFRRDFPYFLQTLSFVLSNGSNMSVAFNEVTNKQGDGVLKEVMLDVITTQRVNGGDFTRAFAGITDKINIDETKEFVEIVQNNLEKGVSVAETFSSQSETIARFIKNKKTRKIKAVSTKILIPILVIIVGIAIFFL